MNLRCLDQHTLIKENILRFETQRFELQIKESETKMQLYS